MISGMPGVSILDNYDSFAHVLTTDQQIASLRSRNIVVQLLPNSGKLTFDRVSFDTAGGEPAIPPEYRASEPKAGESGYYIVQMKGPPKAEWLAELAASGGKIMDIANYYAYIVKMVPETRDAVAQKDFVAWTGLYQPYYTLSGGVWNLRGITDMNVVFFKDGDFYGSLEKIAAMGGIIKYSSAWSSWWSYAHVKIDASRLPEIARMPNVWYVEPSLPVGPFDYVSVSAPAGIPPKAETLTDNVAWVIQSGINGSYPVWEHGIHGENVVVGHADSGLDYDHAILRNTTTDQGVPGPWHRKVVRYWACVNGDNWDDGFPPPNKAGGHGTFTASEILANNIANPGQHNSHDGIAYNAKIAEADVGGGSFNPPEVGLIFQDAANWSATIHSNSWGTASSNAYDANAMGADQYQWDHPEYLIFFAIGNQGPGANTASPPSTAKSIVTLGACNNLMQEYVWEFSSRGPTADGVRKPNLVTPGMNIVGAWSDGAQHTNNDLYKNGTGATSFACPIGAGAGALVEQYFKGGWYPSGQKNGADGFQSSGPLKKAILINSATDLQDATAHAPDTSQGWGRPNLDYSLYFQGDSRKLWLHDEYQTGPGLQTGDSWSQQLSVGGSEPLKISVVWNDYPGHGLKNDLNLMVVSPTGDVYVGSNYANGESVPGASAQPDSINPEECVHVKSPASGVWTIDVTAASVTSVAPQNFSVVVTGDLGIYGITLNAPKTGMTLAGGSSYNIDWATSGGTEPITVAIQYSDNSGGTYTPLASGQPATGTYPWSVPATDITTARIKVVATDANSNVTEADNGDFNITTTPVPEALPAVAIAASGLVLIAIPAVLTALTRRTRNEQKIRGSRRAIPLYSSRTGENMAEFPPVECHDKA